MIVPGIVDTPILDKKHQEKTRGLAMTPSEAQLEPIPFLMRMSGIRALCPPERVAKDVLRGLQANRAMIFTPPASRRPWLLSRFLPGPAEAITVKRFERERKRWDHRPTEIQAPDWKRADGSQIPRPNHRMPARKRTAMRDTRRRQPHG